MSAAMTQKVRAFTVQTDELQPDIRRDEVVMIDVGDREIRAGAVYMLQHAGETVIRRVLPTGTAAVPGDVLDMELPEIRTTDVREIVGRVIGIERLLIAPARLRNDQPIGLSA